MTAVAGGRPVEAVVVGGGPAGLAAATWLARYRRRTLLVDAAEPRNRWTRQTHGYLGRDPVSPAVLLEEARRGLEAYGNVELCRGRVTDVRGAHDDFTVEVDGEEVRTRRLVLATGVVDAFPEVEGFFEHYGVDVFHCPGCDGYEARGRAVVVFGWSPHVTGFVLCLLNWAERVTVVTDGRRLQVDRRHRQLLEENGVEVVEDDATELVGASGQLRGVRLRSGATIPCGMAFFSIVHRPVTDLADRLGCARDDDGYVVVDDSGCTTVPGVYAAGDLVPGLQLVQVAAAKGTTAGVGCALSLQAVLLEAEAIAEE